MMTFQKIQETTFLKTIQLAFIAIRNLLTLLTTSIHKNLIGKTVVGKIITGLDLTESMILAIWFQPVDRVILVKVQKNLALSGLRQTNVNNKFYGHFKTYKKLLL